MYSQIGFEFMVRGFGPGIKYNSTNGNTPVSEIPNIVFFTQQHQNRDIGAKIAASVSKNEPLHLF